MKNLFYITIILIINIIICDDDPMNYIIDNIYLGDAVAAGEKIFLNHIILQQLLIVLMTFIHLIKI